MNAPMVTAPPVAAAISEDAFRCELVGWLESHAAAAPRVEGELTGARVEAWKVWSRRLFEAGYAGVTWPVEHGGRGLGPAHQAVWLEESARYGVPDHLGVIGLGMAGPTIMSWGTAAQQERYLRPILDCSEIWCQGFSEPGSGSDLASVRTAAVAEGDTWLVNGQKVWASFAHLARWCLLLVRTDPAADQHQGLSYLLLDLRSEGVDVRPLVQLTADPEFNEIFLDDVTVPATCMLGQVGDGWKVAMTTLSHERGTHGVGLAARLDVEFRAAVATLSARRHDGTAPLDDPVLRGRLTDIWTRLQALRMTNRRALAVLTATGQPGPGGSIAKLVWSELNQELASLVYEALGTEAIRTGPGAPDGGRWSYSRLRTRGNTIEAGTSEILRNIIAERVLGLPRSR